MSARMAAWSADSRALADDGELREHRRSCTTCDEEYHQSLLVAARIGRERRLARIEAERKARRSSLRRAALAVGIKPRNLWLRTLLVPGLLIVLLTRSFPAQPDARVFALEGSYQLGARTLDAADPPQAPRRGEWIVTEQTGARLDRGVDGTIDIGAYTRVVVADRESGRYLMDAGALTIRGSCDVTTPLGAVEVRDGCASVTVGPERLEVEVASGSAKLIDSLGSRTLLAGERGALGTDGL